ncbi:hypothetical protein F5Y14DRAFT_456134 [Nemania sp. NC0429]|nr:hypothetical protein F5Y14DRAFT_456134 [Nemania sp. NC0429]
MSPIGNQSCQDAFEEAYHDKPESRLLGDTQVRQYSREKRTFQFWGIVSVILTCYSLIPFIAGYYTGSLNVSPRRMSNSPVAEGIEMELRTIDTQFPAKNVYKGTPSAELDDAWSALTNNMHVRISADELEGMNETSISLSDTAGGYLAGVDAVHQIHCLNYIRERAYKEYYEELPMAEMHLDHCIDSIRQTLMCAPNDGLFMYDWSPQLTGPAPRFISRRKCINWSRLTSWAAERRVDLFDTSAVVHPIYGPSYPDGPEETWEKAKHGGFLVQPPNDTAGH